MNKTVFQSQLEQMLSNQGELEAFNENKVFRTTIMSGPKAVLSVVKCHNLVTCYFARETFDYSSLGPSVTVSISEAGKWRFIARHKPRRITKQLSAA